MRMLWWEWWDENVVMRMLWWECCDKNVVMRMLSWEFVMRILWWECCVYTKVSLHERCVRLHQQLVQWNHLEAEVLWRQSKLIWDRDDKFDNGQNQPCPRGGRMINMDGENSFEPFACFNEYLRILGMLYILGKHRINEPVQSTSYC